jgi:hypothetical protein
MPSVRMKRCCGRKEISQRKETAAEMDDAREIEQFRRMKKRKGRQNHERMGFKSRN